MRAHARTDEGGPVPRRARPAPSPQSASGGTGSGPSFPGPGGESASGHGPGGEESAQRLAVLVPFLWSSQHGTFPQAGAEPLPLTVLTCAVTWPFRSTPLGPVMVLSVSWVLHTGTLPLRPRRPREPLHSRPSWPREGQGSHSQQDGFLLVAVDLWESGPLSGGCLTPSGPVSPVQAGVCFPRGFRACSWPLENSRSPGEVLHSRGCDLHFLGSSSHKRLGEGSFMHP